MYKKAIIIASLILQLIAGLFLLAIIIFSDSSPNWLELCVYLLLSFSPYGISIRLYLSRKNIKQSVFVCIGLYILVGFILSLLDGIEDFYVTGMAGIDLVTSISVMAIHSVITFFTIYLLSRTQEQNNNLKKQLPLILLCSVVTFFLFGFFNTLAWKIEPSSYIALGYLDIKQTLSAIGASFLLGFLSIFLKLKILFAITAYTVACLGLIYYREKKSNQLLSFGKKLMLFFAPVWLVIGVYVSVHGQTIKENLTYNFAHFQSVWDHRSQIKPYTVTLNNTSFVVWCDKEPITYEQIVLCGNRLKVSIADKPIGIDESVYPRELNVGMFEKIPKYSDTERNCIYTKNDAIINDKLFLVTTEQCNPRNFPVLAGIEWDEFIRPLLQCFGFANCQVVEMR